MFKTFTVPIPSDGVSEENLNRFLKSKRIIWVQHRLIEHPKVPLYSFLIEYAEDETVAAPVRGTASSGAKHSKNPSTEEVASSIEVKERRDAFWRMVQTRKEMAQRLDQSAYTIMTNAQLKSIALLDDVKLSDLKRVKGVGAATAEKYGAEILAALHLTAVADEAQS